MSENKTIRELLFNGFQRCDSHRCIVAGKRPGMYTSGHCKCLTEFTRQNMSVFVMRLTKILDKRIEQEWQPMATAPLDTMVLLNIEGIVAQGIYSKVDEKWKYANLQIGLYMGKWEDVYFENESTEIPNGWMPMPAATAPEPLK